MPTRLAIVGIEGRFASRRNSSRNALSADFENAGAFRRNAWVRDRQFDSADIERRPPSRRRLLVPRVAADADQGLGDREVGHDSRKPPRSLLPADGGGTQTIRGGNVAV